MKIAAAFAALLLLLGACQTPPPARPVPGPVVPPPGAPSVRPPADEAAVLRGNRFLVSEIQKELKRRGYYKAAVDGAFGPGTKAAIEHYQHDSGLSPDGEPSPALLKHLQAG